MPDKLLTVIVPSYNMEEYLPKCLESLIVPDEAMLQRLDVIVVNDGSKDRTSEIAHDFERRYPGVFRVIDKVNGNYGSCINAALPEAEGFYVKVLDADDSVDTESFDVLCKALAEEIVKMSSASDLVVTDYVTVDADGAVHGTTTYPFPKGANHTLDEMAPGDMRFTIHSIVYRRTIPLEIGYRQTEGISYTDTEWIIEPMIRVRSVRYLSIPVTRYLLGRSGQTMENATLAAMFQQLADIAAGLVSRYDQRRGTCVSEALTYYERQILRVISHVYSAGIWGVNGIRANFDLEAFDQIVRRSPALSGKADGIRFSSRRFPVRFVHNWRCGGTRRCISRLIILFIIAARRCLSYSQSLSR